MMFRLGASAILGIARTNVFNGRGKNSEGQRPDGTSMYTEDSKSKSG